MNRAKLTRLMLQALGAKVAIEKVGKAVLVRTSRNGAERRAMAPTKELALQAALSFYGGRVHEHEGFGIDGEATDPIVCERLDCA